MTRKYYPNAMCTLFLFFGMLFGVGTLSASEEPVNLPNPPIQTSWLDSTKNNLWKNRYIAGTVLGFAVRNLTGSFLPEIDLSTIALIGAGYGGIKWWENRNFLVNEDGNDVEGYGFAEGLVRWFSRIWTSEVGTQITKTVTKPSAKAFGKQIKPLIVEVGNIRKESGTVVKKALLISVGAVAFWYLARFAANRFEQYMSTPHLDVIVKKASSTTAGGTLTQQMIFAPTARKRLNTILSMTHAIKQHIKAGTEGVSYRNLLLYGPPGSGKRMFAEQLAHYARMDFYEIPWSSLNKFKDGDTERAIEHFFKHDATQSENGAVVYIDNAQILFNVSNQPMSTNVAKLVNALIEHAEKRSNRFMVVFGIPSQPNFASDAMLVVDDTVEIMRPELAERKKLLRLYKDLYFKPETIKEETAQAVQKVLDDKTLDGIAGRLHKASAAELAGFMKTLKIESELPTSDGLTSDLIASLEKRSTQRYKELLS